MIGHALGMGRNAAVSRMSETVLVGTFTDGTDPVNLDATRVIVEEFYADIGRVKYPSANVSDREGPSQPVAAQAPILSVPTGTVLLPVGAEVVVTASTVDDLLVGRRYKVDGAPQSGQTTAHRYPLEELS